MASRDIEHAFYVRRLLEKKLDRADPEQPLHCRMRDAMAAMDEQFGEKWRHIMKKSGLDMMPTTEADEPADEAKDESFFKTLQSVSEDEGIGEPPITMHEQEEEGKVRKHKKEEPTIFILIKKHLSRKE